MSTNNYKIDIVALGESKTIDFPINNLVPASCEEMHIHNLLDMLPYVHREQGLKTCLKYLGLNGKVTIIGADIEEISRGLVTAYLSYEDVDKLLYNDKQCSTGSLTEIVEILNGLSYKVLHKRVDSYRFFVEAQRVAASS